MSEIDSLRRSMLEIKDSLADVKAHVTPDRSQSRLQPRDDKENYSRRPRSALRPRKTPNKRRKTKVKRSKSPVPRKYTPTRRSKSPLKRSMSPVPNKSALMQSISDRSFHCEICDLLLSNGYSTVHCSHHGGRAFN